jgi:FHA domain
MTATSAGAPLPSLVAPHYFSGQLLTDADLDALVEWTRARLSLGGRRDGFGVVSGLELRVDPRPGHEADVIVGDGYAVGAAGEDIVVGGDTSLTLADVSLPHVGDPRERHPVDIFLESAQVPYHPKPGFDIGAGSSGTAPGSTYSRVREQFTLSAAAAVEEDPARAAASAFEEAYDECVAPLREYRSWSRATTRGPEQIREWLRSRLLATPFRFAAYELDECSHDELREERTAVRALFWLIQSRRNTFLSGVAGGATRVRLGRVWLLAEAGAAPRAVVAIDAHPPLRRRLHDSRLPAPSGLINATEVIWQLEDVARLTLSRAGAAAGARRRPERFELPHRLDTLERALAGRLFLAPGTSYVLQLYEHRPFGRRVVGLLAEDIAAEVFDDEHDDREPEESDPPREDPGDSDPPAADDDDGELVPESDRPGAVVIVAGPDEGRRFELSEAREVAIGRRGAEITSDDDAEDSLLDSSGRHAVLSVNGGTPMCRPTSKLGIHINGEHVRRERPLQDGDTITVGRTKVRFEARG